MFAEKKNFSYIYGHANISIKLIFFRQPHEKSLRGILEQSFS